MADDIHLKKCRVRDSASIDPTPNPVRRRVEKLHSPVTDGRTDGHAVVKRRGLADGWKPSASWGAPAPQAPRPSTRVSAPLQPSHGKGHPRGTFAVPPSDAALSGGKTKDPPSRSIGL